MGRVLGNPNGEFRGKVGGQVYSRNASGPIIRVYSKPTNPRTDSQQAARNNFRSMTGSWASLTQAQQQSWESFCLKVFNPLRKTNKGQYTGNQAFKSIRQAAFNAIRKKLDTVWKGEPADVALTATIVDPTVVNDAPIANLMPNLQNSTDAPLQFELGTCVVKSDGTLDIFLNWPGVPTGDFAGVQLVDGNGKKFGITCYLSDPVTGVGRRPHNDFYHNLGNSGIPTFSTPFLTGLDGLKVSWDASSLIANFKSFPSAGNICKLTVAGISEDGQIAILGSQYVTITSP